MKSIKPGRGPSGMSFIGSIIAIIFGLFWTVMAFKMTADSPFEIAGMIFPFFGILFIIFGIILAIYNFKNARGKNRYSVYDITDSKEEGDPADKWVKSYEDNEDSKSESEQIDSNFCPYCGVKLKSDFKYCPKCGKTIQ